MKRTLLASLALVLAAATCFAADPAPLAKYDPAVSLSAVRLVNTAYKFPEGDNISNNVWTREIKNTLGIDLKYSWTINDAAQYDNKLNVAIASGDLPDFFACNPATFISLSQSGLIKDLTDVYNKYASPETKALMDAFPEGFNSGKIGGKLMGLSNQGYGLMATTYVVWIREDWLKQSGLAAPKSMADLASLAKAFMKAHPGSYGVALNNALYDDLENIVGIANGFHAYPNSWVKDASGKLAYGSIQPEMKPFLQTLQDWAKAGILNGEFAVNDTDKTNQDLVSGKVGIEFGANWNGYWPFPDAVKKDVKAYFKPYAIPSADARPVVLQSKWPVESYFVVSAKSKNPEAVIKLVNLKTKVTYFGTESQVKTLVGDEAENLSPIKVTDPNADYKIHTHLTAALAKKDGSGLTVNEKVQYDNIRKWTDSQDPDGYGVWAQTSKEGAYEVLKAFQDSGRILVNYHRGAPTATEVEKGATLSKLEKDTFIRIILGAPIGEFDKFVSNWKKLGGDTITAEVNQAFGSK